MMTKRGWRVLSAYTLGLRISAMLDWPSGAVVVVVVAMTLVSFVFSTALSYAKLQHPKSA